MIQKIHMLLFVVQIFRIYVFGTYLKEHMKDVC